MRRADVISMTLLLAGSLGATVSGTAAELPRRQGVATQAAADLSSASGAQAEGMAAVQASDGYHLSPAELAKLREQVRMHWMQGRATSAADAAPGLPLAEDGARGLAR